MLTVFAEAGGPYEGLVDGTVALDGSGSTTDGSIVSYEWDLDNDGQYDDATGATTGFSSSTAGTYTVGLRVTDDLGDTGTDTATVTIDEVSSSPGQMFIVEIDGNRTVVEYWGADTQAWQYTEEGEEGWWPGLGPHPFEYKIWYPDLSDSFNMTLSEQTTWVDNLDYAGIDDWRIANYWDITPLKSSVFQTPLVLDGTTRVNGFDPTVFFQYTSTNDDGITGDTTYYTHGRIGDENGLETGGIIDAGRFDRYSDYGTDVPNRRQLYMLPRDDYGTYGNKGSEAQDHWAGSGPETGQYFYDDALNYTPEDNPLIEQSGERVGGIWTLSEAMPELSFDNGATHTINISYVTYETGYNPRLDLDDVIVGVLNPVTVDGVTDPDAVVNNLADAAQVQLIADENGTVQISFSDGNGDSYSFSIAAVNSDVLSDIFVGNPTDQSITVNVIPDQTGELYFEYGTASGVYTDQTSVLSSTAGEVLETVIDGLTANTEYFYRMVYRESGGAWANDVEYSFNTQRDEGETFVFTITADSHYSLNNTFEQLIQNVLADDPDFHFDLGDTFVTDDLTSQSEVDAVYLDYRKGEYFGAFGDSAPIFLAVGNHENEEGWNFDDTPFSQALASVQARKLYYPTPIDEGAGGFYTGNTDPLTDIDESIYGDEFRENYYAFEWGDALFVVLDPYQYTMDLPYSPDGGTEADDDVRTGDQWSWTLIP